MSVVVSDELVRDALELSELEDQQPVEAFPADGADEPLRKRSLGVLQWVCERHGCPRFGTPGRSWR